MEVNAIVFTGVEKVELGKVTLPELSADQLRVEAVMTCLSPGTDLRVLAGKQAGEWNWPVVPGYSMVGQVIDLGAEVTDFSIGDRVFCIGTQKASCDLLWGANVAVGNVTLGKVVKIPDGLEWEKACMAKLASIAYHGCKRSGATAGSRVSIVGAGPIGLFSALFHQECGATVVVTDVNDSRLKKAGRLGLKTVRSRGRLHETFRGVFPEGADIIVDCTGVEALADECMELAQKLPWDDSWSRGSVLLIQGSYPGRVSLDYELAFQHEIRVVFSRDHQLRDLEEVMDWMLKTDIPFGEIMSEIRPWSDAGGAFKDLSEKKDAYLTIGLYWDSAD